MGGNSTSQSALLSDKKTNASSGFDLHSWQGLTEVLRRGKESLKDAATYAEFRNLVLEYAQRGGDVELRKQIDSVISTFGESKPSSEVAAGTEHSSQNRKRRRKKRAGSDTTKSEAVHEPLVRDTATIPVTARRVKPAFHSSAVSGLSPKAVEPPTTLPVEEDIVEMHKPTSSLTPPPPSSHIPVPPSPPPASQVATPDPTTKPLTEVQRSNQKELDATTFKSIEEYKQRISKIKRIVHEQIGNPVALVDTYGEAGRVYMTSLLSALKATGAGSTESPTAAMQRLEDAFKALRDTPEENTQKVTEATEPIKEVIPESELPREPKILATQKETNIITEPEPEPEPQKIKEAESQEPAKEVHEPSKFTSLPPITPAQEIKEKQGIVEKKDTENKSTEKKFSPAKTLASLLMHDEKKEELRHSDRALHEIPPEKMAALIHEDIQKAKGEARRVATPDETGLKLGDPVNATKVIYKQTELASPKVTQALHQLLQEWSLFKGGGIFGIGPSGSEHRLYQTLAPLSMGEVLSGRWEGSDRNVTKTIKEYVDAWRHEQGVAYNTQETFEHYLRRVIMRIQQRQAGNE